ncbi:hypothetical protein MTO96_050279 [Rhipicephalus appendiculatus]
MSSGHYTPTSESVQRAALDLENMATEGLQEPLPPPFHDSTSAPTYLRPSLHCERVTHQPTPDRGGHPGARGAQKQLRLHD